MGVAAAGPARPPQPQMGLGQAQAPPAIPPQPNVMMTTTTSGQQPVASGGVQLDPFGAL